MYPSVLPINISLIVKSWIQSVCPSKFKFCPLGKGILLWPFPYKKTASGKYKVSPIYLQGFLGCNKSIPQEIRVTPRGAILLIFLSPHYYLIFSTPTLDKINALFKVYLAFTLRNLPARYIVYPSELGKIYVSS